MIRAGSPIYTPASYVCCIDPVFSGLCNIKFFLNYLGIRNPFSDSIECKENITQTNMFTLDI